MSARSAKLESGAKGALPLAKRVLRNRYLYLLLFPGVIYFVIFRYVPMYGLVIAFKDFSVFKGIAKSSWAGLSYFDQLFFATNFWQILGNTLTLSLYKIAVGFPAPVLLALLLNELRQTKVKRVVQTVSYLPYFISWVVMYSFTMMFFNTTDGIVSLALKSVGIMPIDFFASNKWFPTMLVATDVYKNIGYNAIIYLAAITSVNPELYEAAMMDGAKRFRQIWHITLPGISGVVIVLLILNMGRVLEAGFEQVLLFYNPLVYKSGDILDTYIYRRGIVESSYSLTSAAQFFKSIVGMLLVIGANFLSKRVTDNEHYLF